MFNEMRLFSSQYVTMPLPFSSLPFILFTIKTRSLSACRVNAFGILSLAPAMRATNQNTLLQTGFKVEYSFPFSQTCWLRLSHQNTTDCGIRMTNRSIFTFGKWRRIIHLLTQTGLTKNRKENFDGSLSFSMMPSQKNWRNFTCIFLIFLKASLLYKGELLDPDISLYFYDSAIFEQEQRML